MLAEECGLNPFLMERGIDVVESDLGERILQLMHLEPSHIVLPAIHIKREQVGELFEKEMGTEKGNFDPTCPQEPAPPFPECGSSHDGRELCRGLYR